MFGLKLGGRAGIAPPPLTSSKNTGAGLQYNVRQTELQDLFATTSEATA